MDTVLEDLAKERVGPPKVARVRYSHLDMIDTLIAKPWVSNNELAERYGYTPGWVSTVMASDAFQSALAARREEVVDPAMKATLEERFRAVTIQSLSRLAQELDKPACKPEVMLRAAELGAKSLGLGGHAPPPPPPPGDSLARLADRLVALQSNVRQGVTYEGQIERVRESASEVEYASQGVQGPQPGRGEPTEEAVRTDNG